MYVQLVLSYMRYLSAVDLGPRNMRKNTSLKMILGLFWKQC